MKAMSAFRVGLGTVLAVGGIVASGMFNVAAASKSHSSTTTTVKGHAPRVIVSPSGAGLRNREHVKVRGINFTPGDTLYIVECLAKATGPTGCDTSTATPTTPPTVRKNGTFGWTTFVVHTGTIGSGTCGTKRTDLQACAISVGNATGGDTAAARITFVMPKK